MVEELADSVGESSKFVRKDLKKMIRQGFFPAFQAAHQMDGPFVMAQGQGVDFVAAQAATQTFQIHAVRGFVS